MPVARSEIENNSVCPICQDKFSDPVKLKCKVSCIKNKKNFSKNQRFHCVQLIILYYYTNFHLSMCSRSRDATAFYRFLKSGF